MIHGFTELKKDMALKFVERILSQNGMCILLYGMQQKMCNVNHSNSNVKVTIKIEVQLLFKCKLGLFMIKKVKKGQNSVKFPCPA